VPDAAQAITVEVQGAGRLVALDNSDLNDTAAVLSKERKLYQGRAVAIIRSGAGPGKLVVRASAPGLTGSDLTLAVEP